MSVINTKKQQKIRDRNRKHKSKAKLLDTLTLISAGIILHKIHTDTMRK